MSWASSMRGLLRPVLRRQQAQSIERFQCNFFSTGSSTRHSIASSSSNTPTEASPSLSSMPGTQAFETTRRGTFGSSMQATTPYNLHIQSTRNNIILTLTTSEGAPVTRVSAGMCGFKKTGRSGYEAGHQTAIRMFDIIKENRLKWRIANLNLVFKGFGLGRDAVYRALMTDAGAPVRFLVRRVTDATRIRVGGCRPKKRRML